MNLKNKKQMTSKLKKTGTRENKKIIILIVILFSLLALSLSSKNISAQVQQGCFVNVKSPFHCQEINQDLAQQECLSEDGCVFSSAFNSGSSCSTITDCQTILCKATCTQELRSNCGSGEVPSGQENVWCNPNPGCCIAETNDGENTVCQITTNKGNCEILARNKGSLEFSFIVSGNQQTCQQLCQTETNTNTETVGNSPLLSEISAQQNENRPGEINSVDSTQANNNFLLIAAILLLLLLILALIYLSYKKRKYLAKLLHHQKKQTVAESEQQDYSEEQQQDLFAEAKSSKQAKSLDKQHQHKVKQHQRTELLSEIDSDLTELENSNFTKLKEISKKHKLKSADQDLIALDDVLFDKKSQNALKKLKNLVSKK